MLITGGAKRVGAAICRRLHAAGANLMLHYRSSAGEARLLSAELNHVRGNSVALIQADLLDLPKLPSLVEQTLHTFGRLDGLVNNASSFFATPLPDITIAQFDDLVGTNLRAPLFLAQAAAPALRRAGGAIVNIADIHAERPLKNYVVYSVAKAALVGLTRSLARELAPEVRVNAVAPGPVLWPEDDSFDELSRQRIISQTPLKREGTPEDIATAVAFLLEDARYVTGETINVDGGRNIAI
ncbi:MAG: pteridine reductase [Burkholderiales bacterium]